MLASLPLDACHARRAERLPTAARALHEDTLLVAHAAHAVLAHAKGRRECNQLEAQATGAVQPQHVAPAIGLYEGVGLTNGVVRLAARDDHADRA